MIDEDLDEDVEETIQHYARKKRKFQFKGNYHSCCYYYSGGW